MAEKGQLIQNEPDSESQNLEGPEEEAIRNSGMPRSVEQPEN